MPMSNETFLAIVGALIVLLIGGVVLDKYQTCQAAQQNFDQCFRSRGRGGW
jgi:cell division protein FtsN